MAMITCNECGKMYSSKSNSCPNCGSPNANWHSYPMDVVVRHDKGFWSTGRLAIGIISIVLSILILFQSCAAGVVIGLTDSKDAGNGAGIICFFIFLLCGVVGAVTRDSESKVGAVITFILYDLNGIIAIGNAKIYQDLKVWGGLSFAFGIVFFICAIKTTSHTVTAQEMFYEQKLQEANENERVSDIISSGGWKCHWCGNINQEFVSQCGCGRTKEENEEYNRKQEEKNHKQEKEKEKDNSISETERIKVLKEYNELLQNGVITQEEFENKKKELL